MNEQNFLPSRGSQEPSVSLLGAETEQKHRQESSVETRLTELLSRDSFFNALGSQDFESTEAEYQELHTLNRWRREASISSARAFYTLVENFSLVAGANVSSEEKKLLQGHLADRMALVGENLGARAQDLYAGMLAGLEGSHYTPQFPITQEKLAHMASTQDLDYLVSSQVSVTSKLEYLQKRFNDYVRGINALDGVEETKKPRALSEEERQDRQDKRDQASPHPHQESEESKPSMDSMKRLLEGERAEALWLITEARGGYFREKAFDTWDGETRLWKRSQTDYSEARALEECSSVSAEGFVMSAAVPAGQWYQVACPYTHTLAGIEGAGQQVVIREDGNGNYSVMQQSGQEQTLNLVLQLVPGDRKFRDAPSAQPQAGEVFTDETEQVLLAVKKTRSGNIAQALALARHTRQHLTYSNEEKYNRIYDEEPRGYGFAIDTHGQADCDVANTYFALLCQRLKIPVRHVVGHSVKGKYNHTSSAITSGTGHAWSEVWDEVTRLWQRIDATPSGDPNMEGEEGTDGESVPGDYGEMEALGRTDEELALLEKKLSKHVEALSYTPAERRIAEETGIELKEARAIMQEIHRAEDTRLPDGRRIVDALAQLFDMIVESRRHFTQEYAGPLRRRDGGEHIDDVVGHHIGTKAGDSDPASRAKETETPVEEKLFGGFDVYFVGDKSGSMRDTMNSESKWQMQRRALYLLLSALHRFEKKLEATGVNRLSPQALSVRTESISFRGDTADEIDTDKPLSVQFESADKMTLWHSLTKPGVGNGDVTALRQIHQEIVTEQIQKQKEESQSERLRIVLAMTDGYPDSVTGVHQMAEELGKLGAVVVGIGLTESARGVKEIYTTPWSRGDLAESMDDLPRVIAKHVILEAQKLFPEKLRQVNASTFEQLLRGFE
jgi:hypothetical protein